MVTTLRTFHQKAQSQTEMASLRHQIRAIDREIKKFKQMVAHMPAACQRVRLPASTERSMVAILHRMTGGNEPMPVGAELTTQEAADILGVSRPFLIKQISLKKLAFRKVGTHRRILYKDLMDYKTRMDAGRLEALQELTDQAQELNMGY
jgi:excisionase family DNA binding protein